MRQEALTLFITILFVFLLLGLIYAQVLNHDAYYAQSQNNFIRIVPIDGPRGKIFDRNGRIMVNNRLSLDVSCIYQEIGRKDLFIKTLGTVLGTSPRGVIRCLEKASERPFAPVTLQEDVEKERAISLEELEPGVRGAVIEPKSKRDYVYGSAAGHICGYLGEVNEEELDRLRGYGYRMRDLIGRSGLEKYYNNYLTGIDGGEQIEVDARGRRVSLLGLKEPKAGKDLWLTIDARLQQLAQNLLEGKTGAIVLMDPRNGEVLALASSPAYDPNTFVRPREFAERMRLVEDRSKPFLNRAIGGVYAPGSVFKIVTACGALETKKISRYTRFTCTGTYKLGGTTFHCWKEGGHGPQDIIDAIKNSCNVFFYTAGKSLGVDALESYALRFGFGKPTGIDLPEEASGLVPGRLWKMLAKKEAWYDGETVNLAIGQGYLMVTPLQVLRMTACIANGGKLVRPFMVKRIGPVEVGSSRLQDLGLSAETVRIIKEGMLKVVNDDSGTGRRAKVDGLVIGGKTGTAQNPQGVPHAWFIGFAPAENPSLSVVVMVEHGGRGGYEPAEIAHDIFKAAREMGYLPASGKAVSDVASQR